MNYTITNIVKSIIPSCAMPFLLKFYLLLTSFIYKGSNVECPCCEGKFRTFMSFNSYGKIRKNACCPKCGCLERQRLLWLFLKHKTDVFNRKQKLLHIAPEPGLQKLFLKIRSIDYLSADINSPFAMEKMDITNINYPNDYFDFIICSHVLSHVNDDRKAMKELARVVKRNGYVLIINPIDKNRENTFENEQAKTPIQKNNIYGQSDLCRIYGNDFIHRLQSCGLYPTVINYATEIGKDLSGKYGISGYTKIYLCRSHLTN